jgi:hypothetical protein
LATAAFRCKEALSLCCINAVVFNHGWRRFFALNIDEAAGVQLPPRHLCLLRAARSAFLGRVW